MAGRLAEFSRRPPRERAAIYAGAVALLGLLYWQFGLSPLRRDVKTAQAELEGAQSEARKMTGEKRKRDELVAKQEELKKQIEQNQRALPTDAEMPAFFDMLARRFIEAGVLVRHREVRPEITVENFVKAPVEVEISGSYYQILQFFASLRPRADTGDNGDSTVEKDRIVTVENLTVFDPRVINNQLVLTAKFTASTFRATAPEPPPPTPGAAPAKPAATPTPAGAPGTGPATTLPPPTPADAKKAADAANAATVQRANVPGESDPETTVPGKTGGVDRLKGGM